MKKFWFYAFLVIVLMLMLAAAVMADIEVTTWLEPGQSAAVLCKNHQTPEVRYLRAGGVRVICPSAGKD